MAQTAAEMGLRYVVVTSVTRDDLPDGGAELFAATIRELHSRIADVRIEVLIPDFQGDPAALETVLEAGPDVLNHNIETVPRLYPKVRPEAVYDRSLRLLQNAAAHRPAIPVKSGLMLGLGESPEEVRRTLLDLRSHGCTLLTIGQYLQPTEAHLPVTRFVPPEEFAQWRREALQWAFPGWPPAPSCAALITPRRCSRQQTLDRQYGQHFKPAGDAEAIQMIRDGVKLPENVQNKIPDLLRSVASDKDIVALFAFGSLARNALKPMSDLDFGVLLSFRLDKDGRFEKHIKLIGLFTDFLKTDEIDLIDMNDVPPRNCLSDTQNRKTIILQ